jgi:hypothetical protein
VSIFDHDRLQTTVGPADVAADALRVCPMASGFGFADHVLIIIIIIIDASSLHATVVKSMTLSIS